MNLTTDTGSVSQNDMDPDAALDLRVEDLNWQEKQSTNIRHIFLQNSKSCCNSLFIINLYIYFSVIYAILDCDNNFHFFFLLCPMSHNIIPAAAIPPKIYIKGRKSK